MARTHSLFSKFLTGLATTMILWYFEFGKGLLIWFVNLFKKFINFVYSKGIVVELGVSLMIAFIIMNTFVGTILTEAIDKVIGNKT